MMVGSVLPVIALFVSHDVIFWSAVAAAGVAVLLEVTRFGFGSANDLLLRYFGVFFKEKERQRVTGSTYLLIGTVGAFHFLDKTVAIIALLFLALGDPSAAMIGSRWGRLRVGGKTLEGSAAFLAVSLLVGGIFVLTGTRSRILACDCRGPGGGSGGASPVARGRQSDHTADKRRDDGRPPVLIFIIGK